MTDYLKRLIERCGKPRSLREVRGDSEIAALVVERTEDREHVFGKSVDRQILRRGDGRILISQRSAFPLVPDATTSFNLKQLVEQAGLPWDPAYEGRAFPVWSSDERVNRYGDIDLQQWNFDNYNRNPLVLFSHNWDGLPIGNSIYHKTETRVDGTAYSGPALKQIMLFATKEQSEQADSVYRLWKARFLRTVSVGFYPGVVIDVEDSAERAKLGLGKWGLMYGDEELVEVSPTSVPALPSAHASALKEAAASNTLQASDIDVLREFSRKEAKAADLSSSQWRELDATIRSIWQNVFPGTKIKEHLDIDAPAQYDASFASAEETKRFERLLAETNSRIEALDGKVKELAARTATKESNEDRASREALEKIDRTLASIAK